MQHLVGHAAHQQGGKIGVATRAHHDQGSPCSLAASRMRRTAEPYMVWRRSTRARSPTVQVHGVLLGELDRPPVILEVPLGGVGPPDRAGARSRGRRRSHLRRPRRSWRPARPPSRGSDPSTATRMVPNIAGSPPWVAWWQESPSPGAGLQGWLISPATDGPANKARRTPDQLALSRSKARNRLAGST
jgi:hypothetical protein